MSILKMTSKLILLCCFIIGMSNIYYVEAVRAITEARQHWRDLVAVTDEHIQSSHLAIFKETRDFHWKDFQDEVDAEVNWVKSR